MSVQSAAPRKAHTESKAGKAMEMQRSTATTVSRIEKRMRDMMISVRRDAVVLLGL